MAYPRNFHLAETQFSIDPDFSAFMSFLKNGLRYFASEAKRDLHWDLVSYLNYIHLSKLNQHSAVHVGTLYEYTVLHHLTQKFGLTDAKRLGGAGDSGVDILGNLIGRDNKVLSVMVQCKSSNSKLTPSAVRELIGTFESQLSGTMDESSTLLICASPSPLTSQALRTFKGSSKPLLHTRILKWTPAYSIKQEEYDLEGLSTGLSTIYVNQAASDLLREYSIELPQTH